MVFEKELAIIFKRKRDKKNNEYYIPIEVVEGHYDEEDHLFIDLEDNTYHHICEFINGGKVFGCRKYIKGLDRYDYQDKKRKILDVAREFTYIRRYDNEFEVMVIQDNEEKKYQDIDTLKDEEKWYQLNNNEYQMIQINMDNPALITSKIKEDIIGQDEAIKTIVTNIILNNSTLVPKNNLLVIGPTGVGKTFIFEKMSKIMNIPLIFFSIPGLSQAGYVGKSIDDILKEIVLNTKNDPSSIERCVVILDEIDKIAFQGKEDGRISTLGVQNELLKLIEGEKRWVSIAGKDYQIDTSKITFVGIGAFQELYQDKTKNSIGFVNNNSKKEEITNSEKIANLGFKRELIGRLPLVVELKQLTKEDLINIMKSDNSIFSQNIKALNKLGITCKNLDFLYEIISCDAIKRKIGARGLKSTISKIFSKIFYEVLSHPEYYQTLTFGNNILEDNEDFLLNRKDKVKRRINERI